eukprot:12438739-Ditylum_brightwellii.AAC.1
MSASTSKRIQTSQECMKKSRTNSNKKMSTDMMKMMKTKLKTHIKMTQKFKMTIRAQITIHNTKTTLLMSTKLANMLRLTPTI